MSRPARAGRIRLRVSVRWWTAHTGWVVRNVARCILCGSRRTVAEVTRGGCFGVIACDACGAS